MLRQRLRRHRTQPELLLQIFDRAESVKKIGSIGSPHFQDLVLVDLLPDHILTRRVLITGGQEPTVWTAAVDKEPL